MWFNAPQNIAEAPIDRQAGRAGFLRLFADDFVTRPAGPAAPPAPPTADDVTAAYAEGMRAGAQSATTNAARQAEATMQTLLDELANLSAEATQATEAIGEAVAQLMLSALRAFFPEMAQRFGPAEAVAATRLIVDGMHFEPEVTIRGTLPTIRALEPWFASRPEDQTPRIILVPTDAMTPGDVSIRWRNGEARRDTGRLWLQFTEALGVFGLTVPPALLEQEIPHE